MIGNLLQRRLNQMFHQKNFFHISQSPNLQNEKMTLDRLLINLIVGFVKRINASVLLAGDNRGGIAH